MPIAKMKLGPHLASDRGITIRNPPHAMAKEAQERSAWPDLERCCEGLTTPTKGPGSDYKTLIDTLLDCRHVSGEGCGRVGIHQ